MFGKAYKGILFLPALTIMAISLVSCSHSQIASQPAQATTSEFTADEHTLYLQHFDESNGTDKVAKFGRYSLGPLNEWITVHCKDIGLFGKPEYTIEFWFYMPWLKESKTKKVVWNSTLGPGWFLSFRLGPGSMQLEWQWYLGYRQRITACSDGIIAKARNWYHIMITGSFETGTHSIYVNGVERVRLTSCYEEKGWLIPDLTFAAGDGYIDEIRISDVRRKPVLKRG